MTKDMRELLDQKAQLVTKAKELRTKDGVTVGEVDSTTTELRNVNAQIEQLELIENSGGTPPSASKLNTKLGGSELKSELSKLNTYKNKEEFIKAFTKEESDISMSEYMNGILFNNWSDENAYKFKNKVDGTVIVPERIISEIIYSAQAKSVLLNNCPIIPMEEAVCKIGRINNDVNMDFKVPYQVGIETDLGLEGVELVARTLYSWIQISEEDLQDIKNLNSILINAFSGAIGKSLDNAFLYNQYEADDAPVDKAKYPNGIMDNENICNVTVPNAEFSTCGYDAIINAFLEVEKNNGEPDTIALNPLQKRTLNTSKDSTGRYLSAPECLEGVNRITSNNIKDKDLLVFDSNQIVIGIRKKMDIKLVSSIKDGTVLLRCMFRADVATTREKHICKVAIEAA